MEVVKGVVKVVVKVVMVEMAAPAGDLEVVVARAAAVTDVASSTKWGSHGNPGFGGPRTARQQGRPRVSPAMMKSGWGEASPASSR